jgi:hypothetical protein
MDDACSLFSKTNLERISKLMPSNEDIAANKELRNLGGGGITTLTRLPPLPTSGHTLPAMKHWNALHPGFFVVYMYNTKFRNRAVMPRVTTLAWFPAASTRPKHMTAALDKAYQRAKDIVEWCKSHCGTSPFPIPSIVQANTLALIPFSALRELQPRSMFNAKLRRAMLRHFDIQALAAALLAQRCAESNEAGNADIAAVMEAVHLQWCTAYLRAGLLGDDDRTPTELWDAACVVWRDKCQEAVRRYFPEAGLGGRAEPGALAAWLYANVVGNMVDAAARDEPTAQDEPSRTPDSKPSAGPDAVTGAPKEDVREEEEAGGGGGPAAEALECEEPRAPATTTTAAAAPVRTTEWGAHCLPGHLTGKTGWQLISVLVDVECAADVDYTADASTDDPPGTFAEARAAAGHEPMVILWGGLFADTDSASAAMAQLRKCPLVQYSMQLGGDIVPTLVSNTCATKTVKDYGPNKNVSSVLERIGRDLGVKPAQSEGADEFKEHGGEITDGCAAASAGVDDDDDVVDPSLKSTEWSVRVETAAPPPVHRYNGEVTLAELEAIIEAPTGTAADDIESLKHVLHAYRKQEAITASTAKVTETETT